VQRRPASSLRGMVKPLRLENVAGVGATTTQVYYSRGVLVAQEFLNEGAWFELEERTRAYNDARTQALARLRAAAREVGALAVVDVHIRRGKLAQARRAIEFTALGTAIASDRFEPGENEPIPLVGIGGVDFWKLVDSGTWPLGLVGGTSVVYVVSGYRTKFARFRPARRSLRNQEYEDYTEGLRNARLRATGRLRHEATQLGATGVIGIAVGRERREQRDDNLMVTVDLLGTAVAPLDRGEPRQLTYALGLGNT
jgi:uncharacterized protein YbjQ (UPF0145 family)